MRAVHGVARVERDDTAHPSSSKWRLRAAGVNRRSEPSRPAACTVRGSTSRRPVTYQGLVRWRSWATLGWAGSHFPKTASARGRVDPPRTLSSNAASRCPSASRSARCPQDSAFRRVLSSTSRVTGMGHSVPSLRRMRSQTPAWSASSMKPVSGENAPHARSSRSHRCRSVRSRPGQSVANRSSSPARSRSTTRSTSRLPWGLTDPAPHACDPPPSGGSHPPVHRLCGTLHDRDSVI